MGFKQKTFITTTREGGGVFNSQMGGREGGQGVFPGFFLPPPGVGAAGWRGGERMGRGC